MVFLVIIFLSKTQDNNDSLSYWLSNSTTLLLLLQRTLKAGGATGLTPHRRRPSSTSLFGRVSQVRESNAPLSFQTVYVPVWSAIHAPLLNQPPFNSRGSEGLPRAAAFRSSMAGWSPACTTCARWRPSTPPCCLNNSWRPSWRRSTACWGTTSRRKSRLCSACASRYCSVFIRPQGCVGGFHSRGVPVLKIFPFLGGKRRRGTPGRICPRPAAVRPGLSLNRRWSPTGRASWPSWTTTWRPWGPTTWVEWIKWGRRCQPSLRAWDLLTCALSLQVPPFLVRKVFTQIFSFINVQLFNRFLVHLTFWSSVPPGPPPLFTQHRMTLWLSLCSLLLRRECCSFSNGEYVKAGLAELEQWCFDATEEVTISLSLSLHPFTHSLSLSKTLTRRLETVFRVSVGRASAHQTGSWISGTIPSRPQAFRLSLRMLAHSSLVLVQSLRSFTRRRRRPSMRSPTTCARYPPPPLPSASSALVCPWRLFSSPQPPLPRQVLSIQQLYRISTMYWDDMHGTHSVSSDVRS